MESRTQQGWESERDKVMSESESSANNLDCANRDASLRNWKGAQFELKKDISIHNSSSEDHKGASATFKRKKKTRAEYQKEYRQRLKEKNIPTPTQKSEEQRKRKAANSKAYRERKKRLREKGILTLTQKSDEQRKRKAANSKAYRERKKRLGEGRFSMQKYSIQESSVLQTQRENPFETVTLIHKARTPGPNENGQIEKRIKMDNSVSHVEHQRDPDLSTSWIIIEEEKIPPKLTLESIGLRRNNHNNDLNLEETFPPISNDGFIGGVNSNDLQKLKTESIQQNGNLKSIARKMKHHKSLLKPHTEEMKKGNELENNILNVDVENKILHISTLIQGVAPNASHNDGQVKEELEIGPTELQKSSAVVPNILMRSVRKDNIPETSVGGMKSECVDALYNETMHPDYDFNKERQLVTIDCVKIEPEDEDTNKKFESVKPIRKGKQFVCERSARKHSIPETSVRKVKSECDDGLHNETMRPDYDFNKKRQLVTIECVKIEPEDEDTDQELESVKPVCKEQFVCEQQIQKANMEIEFEIPGLAPNEIKLEKNSMESVYPFHMEYLVEVTPTVEDSDCETGVEDFEDIKPIFIEEPSTSKPEETAVSFDGDPLGPVQHASASTLVGDIAHEAQLPKDMFKRSPFSQRYDGHVPLNCLMCDVKFNESSCNLVWHRLTYNGKKFFICEICDEKFNYSNNLVQGKRIQHNDKSFICELCNKRFTTSAHLKQHKLIHTGEKPFSCDLCNAKFNVSGNLVKHKRIHTGERPFSCDVCDKRFTTSAHLKQHKLIHTGEKPFSCELCNAKFNCSSNLTKHKLIHAGEKPFTCEICDKRFTKSAHLKQHKRIHTGEKPFSCDLCNAKFNVSCNLVKHKRIHTGERPFSCEICHKKFITSAHLKQHERIHTGEKPFSCDLCNAKFNVSCNLVKHKRIHTGEKPFSCDTCNKSFTTSAHLKQHKRIHTGEKPFSCDLCNTKFNCSSNLLKHKQIHAGEKRFICEFCNKKFTTSTHLKQHKRIHTGEKPFSCDLCNAKFNVASNLVKHKRIHTGEKPFSCDICNKKFRTSAHVKEHKRIHTGERPFKCESCNTKFYCSNSLVKHKRLHCNNKSYPCEICNKNFTEPADLNLHIQMHIGETPFGYDVGLEII